MRHLARSTSISNFHILIFIWYYSVVAIATSHVLNDGFKGVLCDEEYKFCSAADKF